MVSERCHNSCLLPLCPFLAFCLPVHCQTAPLVCQSSRMQCMRYSSYLRLFSAKFFEIPNPNFCWPPLHSPSLLGTVSSMLKFHPAHLQFTTPLTPLWSPASCIPVTLSKFCDVTIINLVFIEFYHALWRLWRYLSGVALISCVVAIQGRSWIQRLI